MSSKDFVCTGTYWMLANAFVMRSPDFPLTGMVRSKWRLCFRRFVAERYCNKRRLPWYRHTLQVNTVIAKGSQQSLINGIDKIFYIVVVSKIHGCAFFENITIHAVIQVIFKLLQCVPRVRIGNGVETDLPITVQINSLRKLDVNNSLFCYWEARP